MGAQRLSPYDAATAPLGGHPIRERHLSGAPESPGSSMARQPIHVASRENGAKAGFDREARGPPVTTSHTAPGVDPRVATDPNVARRERNETLPRLLSERIVVLDGATGTFHQGRPLDEAEFRGRRFADHPRDLKGAIDILSITQPELVLEAHRRYLAAGADLISTNTFNATRVAMAD